MPRRDVGLTFNVSKIPCCSALIGEEFMLSGFIKINIRQARTLIHNIQLGLRMAHKREALRKLTNAQRLDIGKTLYEVKI